MKFEYLLGGGLGFLTAIMGGWHITLQILLVLMLCDVISGVIKGKNTTGITSKQLRTGLMTKASFFLVLILAYQIDLLMGNSTPLVRTAVASFYIAVEGISIVENLGVIGVPVPKFIATKLSQLKDISEQSEAQQQQPKQTEIK